VVQRPQRKFDQPPLNLPATFILKFQWLFA
jgi:hypothetical protein